MDPRQGQGPSEMPLSELTDEQKATMVKNYKFSPDEMRVLQECNNESFYKRSLPLSTALGMAAYLGVKSGYFKGSPRFGAGPKVFGVVVVGYFLGKISYQQKCAEKLMALPGSVIGQLLRERQNKGVAGWGGSGFDTTGFSAFNSPKADVYSDISSDTGPKSSLDLDTDRPTFKGLEETYKPSLDSPSFGSLSDPLPKAPGMSYDDLRKKNRDEYSTGKPQQNKAEPTPPTPVRIPVESTRKNQYGDTFD